MDDNLPDPYKVGQLLWHKKRRRFGIIASGITTNQEPLGLMAQITVVGSSVLINDMLDMIRHDAVEGDYGYWFMANTIVIEDPSEKAILALMIKYG